jgi:hypothetical protein
VSFDNGRAWQPLQQNLPATPVTDLRVQRGDLVVATMGRSFWIMDNVAPLRALAARAATASTDVPASGTPSVLLTGVPVAPAGQGPGRTVFDASQPVLLPPATRVRYRSGGGGGRGGPQYAPMALAIDYILPPGFSGALTLEITDAQGRVVRTVQSATVPPAGRGTGEVDMQIGGGGRGGGRGRGSASALTTRVGHNRFMWDYRWTGNGPVAAPGQYTVSLTAGGSRPLTQPFEVAVDPRVLADGVTAADLVEQQDFLLEVRTVQARAIALRGRVQEAMQQAGVEPHSPPGPGESPFRRKPGTLQMSPLQALYARLVTPPGTYQQGMIIDQLNNIVRAEGGADQKVGAEARRRLRDLLNEIAAIEAEFGKL